MDRSDWLLLFVARAAPRPVDPVRLQKGLFLLAMSGALPPAERYPYEPYAYGPMSRLLYKDVDRACDASLLARRPVQGASWQALAPTARGLRRVEDLRARARRERPQALAEVHRILDEIGGLSFAELLARVYDRHPEYAVRSVFRRP